MSKESLNEFKHEIEFSKIQLLEENKHLINWDNLCFNINAASILEQNKDKINWTNISSNPFCMELIKNNLDNKLD